MPVNEGPNDYVSIPVDSGVFLRTDVLIQLTDTVWINPQHVVGVEFYAKDHMTAANDPRVIVYTTAANHVLRDRTLAEVVELING